jgi:nucleotide-binding universal stress UspA family protein
MYANPPRSVLVGADLSGASGEVLRSAAAVALSLDAELHVLHALEPSSRRDTEVESSEEGAALLADAERSLHDLIRRTLPPHAPVVSTTVSRGPAYRALLERAREVHADLIVVGATRRAPDGQPGLGGTTDRILRTADVPCLIVRAPLSFPLGKVVVPVDLSTHTPAILAVVLGCVLPLAATYGMQPSASDLQIVHVTSAADQDVAAKEKLEAIVHSASGDPEFRPTYTVFPGSDPAVDLLAFAAEVRPDLVVLGTHSDNDRDRALVGSVACAFADSSPASVLLVPRLESSASQILKAGVAPTSVLRRDAECDRGARHPSVSRGGVGLDTRFFED